MDGQISPEQLVTISYRMGTIERDMQNVHSQLATFVPVRENDYQIQSIRSTVERIERDVGETNSQVMQLSLKLAQQEKDARDAAEKVRQERDQFQIKALWYFAGLVVTVLLALLIAHLTHYV